MDNILAANVAFARSYAESLLTDSVEFGVWSGAGGDWAGGSTARTFTAFSPTRRIYPARVFQTAGNLAWNTAAGRPLTEEVWTVIVARTANLDGVTVISTAHGLMERVSDNAGQTDQIDLVITAKVVR
jgi:hypothetical protein